MGHSESMDALAGWAHIKPPENMIIGGVIRVAIRSVPRGGRRGLAPHLSPRRTLVSLDLSAIGAGQARALQFFGSHSGSMAVIVPASQHLPRLVNYRGHGD